MTEPVTGATSAGSLLRAAREKQGLHIAALAAAIKVAPRKLDALEHDRWNELPDATFARALAQTVCRTLKIDARPVLELLPPAGGSSLEVSGGGLNTPFRDRPGRDEPGLAGAAIRPMIAAASLLMVAAVVVYFLPDGLWSPRGAAPAPAAVAASAPASSAAPAAAVVDAMSSASAATAGSEPVFPPPMTGTPPVVAAVEPVPPPAASAPAAPATAPAAQTVISAAAGPVQLHAQQASWVEARDARGQLLLSRILQPGETLGLEGSLPIRLTIGNAAATTLAFRGQPVDLAASTRDNVARIELR